MSAPRSLVRVGLRAALLVMSAAGCQRCTSSAPPGASGEAGLVSPDFPEPVVLADKQPAPSAVAVDESFVYWNNVGAGVVSKAPKGGGPITKLYESASPFGGRSIALDRDAVYFDEAFMIKRVPKAGGPVTNVGHVPQIPVWMTADDDGVYAASDTVLRFAKDGSSSTSLSSVEETWAVASDVTHVYWVARDGVRRAAKNGGRVETLARGTFRFCKMALSDTEVFWGDAVLEAVFAVPKAGGRARLVAHAWDIASKRLVVDARAVWVLQSGGRLERIDAMRGTVTVVAVSLARGGSADQDFGLALSGEDAFVAAGGTDVVGAGPVHIDLTGSGDAAFPTMTHGGQVLRVATAIPPGAITKSESALEIARVWFQGTSAVAQDLGNATRWIGKLDAAVVPDVRAGRLGVTLLAFVGDGVGEDVARARAKIVEDAIVAQLGARARVATTTPQVSGYRGDVQVTLDQNDLATLMAPPPERRDAGSK